jgi:hypothetical protein
MILSGCAVQRNGLGSWLASSRYRLMRRAMGPGCRIREREEATQAQGGSRKAARRRQSHASGCKGVRSTRRRPVTRTPPSTGAQPYAAQAVPSARATRFSTTSAQSHQYVQRSKLAWGERLTLTSRIRAPQLGHSDLPGGGGGKKRLARQSSTGNSLSELCNQKSARPTIRAASMLVPFPHDVSLSLK